MAHPRWAIFAMTWSIVAKDEKTGAFGVAVTTKFFAVGALCPHAMSGIGALATQALVNPIFGPRGLRLLAQGVPAAVSCGPSRQDDRGPRRASSRDRCCHRSRAYGRRLHRLVRASHACRVLGRRQRAGRCTRHRGLAAFDEAHAAPPLAARLIGALDAGQA
jgi:hypothetical protein